ncbi:hypothetical protein [Consotaella salsifontis]|uniref:Uncharacterized protein n=1 Tax=Consotaella salsifontis TaxID=1365950 RepID=A0A1T4PSQ8_9HYPH|nr:hypothetical protein [Consotaella salsifontis]SJZ94563.1 hypothetical protein SAMN05428963_104138 [Consotaella salsifontis]
MLVMDEDALIAVLVRLDSDFHQSSRGKWFLEAGFGELSGRTGRIFDDLEGAGDWIEAQRKHGAH